MLISKRQRWGSNYFVSFQAVEAQMDEWMAEELSFLLQSNFFLSCNTIIKWDKMTPTKNKEGFMFKKFLQCF